MPPLVALVIEGKATIIDEIIDLHDRIIGRIFSKAKHKHHQVFQESGKAINEALLVFRGMGKAILEANANQLDLSKAIEAVISWEALAQSIQETETLVQSQ